MPYDVADRVLEISNTSGTVPYVLQGAHTGYQPFVLGIGDGKSTLYAATNDVDWEVGVGTITAGSPDTLSRDVIISSSNGGNAVDWGSDDKVVYCAPTAEYMRHLYWDIDTDRIGINTNGPARVLEINVGAAIDGIRLSYDAPEGNATEYAEVMVGANGDLTVTTMNSGVAGVAHITLDPDGKVFVLDASDNVLAEFGEDVVRYGAQAAYKSAAQLGDFPQSLATRRYVDDLDKSDVLSGHLTYVSEHDPGGYANGVWGDGKFIYLAARTGGLHVYRIDGNGTPSLADSDDQGDEAYAVWGDGKFIYLANYTGGLHVYSVSETGILTHIDSDDQGNGAVDVWGDGRFVYLANAGGGLHVYSVGDTGVLTHIGSDYQGDNARGIWGDGKFLYLANGTIGLHVYSIDGHGTLTHIGFEDQGDNAQKVWGDGRFIYLANATGGVYVYSVSNSGVLTHVDSDDQGDSAADVWGDGKFLYLGNGAGGLHVYTVSDSGTLTHIDSDDQGNYAQGVWGDDRFIYLANHDSGLIVYSVDKAYEYDQANETHTFDGNYVNTRADLSVMGKAAYHSPAQLGDFPQSLATKEYVYSLDTSDVLSGHLTWLDSDIPVVDADVWSVWGDGKFVFAGTEDHGLNVYSVDNSGTLTWIDSHVPVLAGRCRGVWGDGRFVYMAFYQGGLYVYSVSDAGILTHVDFDNQGDHAYTVHGDGKFLYLANHDGGVHVYSVSDEGLLTHLDSDLQVGSEALDLWTDGKFVYVANSAEGLHVYSVSDAGILTWVDSDAEGDNAFGVWGDGQFIYSANSAGGLHVYSVSDAGILTHVDFDDQGDTAYGVWGDGKFIYLANDTGGLHVYSVDEAGTLTHLDFDDQGDRAWDVWGDRRFIYLANATSGLHVYSVDKAYEYDQANEAHIFSTGGSERARITSEGFVGIGTDSPDSEFHVVGAITLDRVSSYSDWISSKHDPKIYAAHNEGASYPFTADDLGHLIIQPRTSAPRDIIFATGSSTPSPRLVVTRTGEVGIGSSAPDKKLEINTGAADDGIRISHNDADGSATDYAEFIVGADGDLTITTVDSDGVSGDIILDPDGNVGIGTDSPNQPLEVSGASFDTTPATGLSDAQLSVTNPTETTNVWAGIAFNCSISGTITPAASIAAQFEDISEAAFLTSSLVFNVTGVGAAKDVMYLDSTGSLLVTGVGNFIPDGKLHVKDSSATVCTIESTTSNAILQLTTGDAEDWLLKADSGDYFVLYHSYDSNNYEPFIVERATPTDTMRLTSDGYVGIGNATPGGPLDILDATSPQLRLTETADSEYNELRSNNGDLTITSSGTYKGVYNTNARVGGSTHFTAHNTDDTNSGSRAMLKAMTEATGGDPLFALSIISTADWSIGVDSSDSQKLKIGSHLTVGTNTAITVQTNGKVGIGTTTPATECDINGALTLQERSSDPADPSEGATCLWMSDGTGSGDDGDIMMKITAGGVTKTVTLVDFSAQ